MKKIWLLILIILCLIVFIITILTPNTNTTLKLRLATGQVGSDSYAYGLSYQALLKDENIELYVVPTQGSLDTIGYLTTNKVDIGFVHSGILSDKKEYDFESIASVYSEPLWIFYRNDGYNMEYLAEATSKKIGISLLNDGTYDIVNKLFEANKLNSSIIPSYIDDSFALEQLKNKSIDIFITLSTKENTNIQKLLEEPSINVMSIKRAKAYIKQFNYLNTINLSEGSLDLYKNIPFSDITLLSTTQNLVSNKNISDELIRIFLKKVNQIHENISSNYVDTVMNSEAEIYLKNGESWLETIFPYWIASQIDRLKLFLIPLIWLIIPLFKGIIPLYIFTIRSKIFKWYEKLQSINIRIKNGKEDIYHIEKDLRTLQEEIENKTKVPPSYMGEYYNLILHIELLEKKIEMIRMNKDTNETK